MAAEVQSTLDQFINVATLTPVVQQLLGRQRAEVGDWRVRPAGPVFTPQTLGIQRVDGTARDGAEVLSWSVVLKISVPTANNADDVTASHYWKRELLAYQSDLLADLPGSLVAPRCYGVVELADRSTGIWLEAIDDVYERRWPLARVGLAARHLGFLNGTFLVGRPLPTYPWLSRSFVHSFSDLFAPSYDRYREFVDHPYVRRNWPGDLAERELRLWSERPAMLDALARLPSTFCHLDAFRRNLLARRRGDGREETVAIDWAFTGIGAIGEEMACMVASDAMFFEIDATHLRAQDEIVFEGYLEGLREAGWDGDPRLARFGYAAASALRYGLIPLGVLTALEAQYIPFFERGTGHSFDEVLDRHAETQLYLLDLADEARELMTELW